MDRFDPKDVFVKWQDAQLWILHLFFKIFFDMTGLFTISFFTPCIISFYRTQCNIAKTIQKKLSRLIKMSVENPRNPRKLVKKKRYYFTVSVLTNYILIFPFLRKMIIIPNWGEEPASSPTIFYKDTLVTEFNNSGWEFYFKYTSTCNFMPNITLNN